MCSTYQLLIVLICANDNPRRIQVVIQSFRLTQKFRTKQNIIRTIFLPHRFRISNRNRRFNHHDGIRIRFKNQFNHIFHSRCVKEIFIAVVICRCSDDNKLRILGLYGINWIYRTCELGVYIGDPEQHGKGLGSEAYRLIEEFAVRYLNLRKIKAFVVSNNDSAVHMYEKLGFEKAGELKEERFINGKYCSVYIMEKFIGGGYFLTDYYSRYMPLQVEVA